MPKSKRAKVVHLTQVAKKTRADKEKLFENIRACVPKYRHCFVFGVDNMRNNHLKAVRQDLGDSRLFFGKTKLMARALGTTPEDAQADGLDRLSAAHLRGSVGLLFTDRSPDDVAAYFSGLSPADFARAGTAAVRTVVVPAGPLYATAGQVDPAHDVPVSHALEPELRRLGMPTRMVSGRVVLDGVEGKGEGGGYTICKEGETLDSRQTRLLKLFGFCLSEFRVRLLAYWTAETGVVTEVDPIEEGEGEEEEMEEDDD